MENPANKRMMEMNKPLTNRTSVVLEGRSLSELTLLPGAIASSKTEV